MNLMVNAGSVHARKREVKGGVFWKGILLRITLRNNRIHECAHAYCSVRSMFENGKRWMEGLRLYIYILSARSVCWPYDQCIRFVLAYFMHVKLKHTRKHPSVGM